MLQTQFLGAGASGFYGPMSGLGYSPADITALQNALIKAGKTSVKATGVMDGQTAAAMYEIIRDKGGAVGAAFATIAGSSSVASGIQSAFSALQSKDSTLQSVPGVSLSIPSLLRDASKVSMVVSVAPSIACAVSNSLCSRVTSIAGTIQNALNTFFSKLSDAAPTLLKVIGILVPGSTSGAAPTTTTVKSPLLSILATSVIRPQAMQVSPSPTATTGPATTAIPAGSIYAPSSKFPGKFRVAIPRAAGGLGGLGVMSDGMFGECMFGDCGLGAAAAFTEVAPVTAPPAGATQVTEKELEAKTGQTPFYKKPLFWVAVAGGVVVIGGGGYWLVRRRKKAV